MQNLTRLLRGLKKYKKEAILGPIFIMGAVLMDLLLPAIMQRMIDTGVANQDLGYIARMSLLMMLASFLGMGFGLISNYFASIASQRLGGDLRESVFAKIMSLSKGNVDRLETGQLITMATNDVNQVQMTVLMGLKIAMRSPLMLLGGLALAIVTSPSLSLIILLMVPLLLFGLIFLIRYAFPMFSKVQEKIDKVNGVIGENLSGIRVIKAFVRADFEQQRFGRVNEDLFETSILAFRRIALLMPLLMLISNMAVVAALYLGGVDFAKDGIMIGQIQAFINYLGLIMFSLFMMAMVLTMISRAEASSKRIVEVLSQVSEVPEVMEPRAVLPMKGKVEFRHVCFQYYPSEQDYVLKDIDFVVQPGETVAILGATGSGKSSLIHLIPRFYDVTQGQVLIDDVDVREWDQKVLRQHIGMALQVPILFSGTVEDNLRFANEKATQQEMEDSARLAQAHDFIVEMPEGYQTLLGQRGVNLSGGQKQRLSIARAVIHDPQIIILDDSTSAVDAETESKIQKSMNERFSGHTSFIIAQRISTVLEADKIIVLDDGMIKGMGTHESLMETNAIYRDIYESQLGGM